MNWELAYRIGFHPWEDAEDQPGFIASLDRLLEGEEEGREPPYGPALDVGTGSGIWATHLARRGWQVTGVDLVARALERARTRISDAEVDVRVVQGDVTALAESGVGEGYRLALDTGTFHDFPPAERDGMARSLDEVLTADATVLLLAWAPRRRGPIVRGAGIEDLRAAFPGWRVIDEGPTGYEAPKPIELLLRPGERWYRLTRA